MADTEIVEGDDKQAALDFNSGFTAEAPPVIPETPKTEVAEEKPKPAETPKTEPKAPPKVDPVVVAPKYVQITEDQFANLQSAAAKTVDFEKRLSQVFGTVGNMQQIVKTLQSATPQGMTVELPPDVVSEMEKDFPELASHFKSALEKLTKGIRGTAPANPNGSADPEAINKLVSAAMEAESTKREIGDLGESHPTWREIVGAVGAGEKPDPNHPFRTWLGRQPVEYQTKVNETNSARVISGAIDKFLADQKAEVKPAPKPAPKDVARTDRIRDAIQPKGDGGPPASSKTAEDEFAAGFREG